MHLLLHPGMVLALFTAVSCGRLTASSWLTAVLGLNHSL